ncbi:unnamed protein product [Sphagnum jensenii]|uniref:DUF1995 domain-containing protein n=1 Tax=Sphagnum jensenii TaxID=128206 RepID=A0ABP0VPE5_9BRYO
MAAVVGHATTAISCMWKPEILCTKHGFTKACNVGATPSSPQVSHVLKCSKAIIWQTDLKVLRKGILRVAALEEKGSHILVSEAQQTWPNPQTMEEAVKQAGEAVQRAIASGKQRQKLQLLLPVDQRQFNYLDTEPRDYPCGIRDEFIACSKMIAAMFKSMSPLGDKDEVLTRRIGEKDNEMDPVGLLYPADKSIAAIVFPIAETLKQVRSLASSDESRPLLLVNPQWRLAGQVVSDFGFGPWRRQAEEFVDTFETTYTLIEQRVGEASNVTSSSGGVVRILKCFPGDWQVYLMAADGTSEMIGVFPAQPIYKDLEKLVSEARKRIPWKAPPRILGGSEPPPPPLPSSLSGALSEAQIEEMDVQAVRRALMALNLPSSGRLATLKDRLKEAQKG